jgi:hypothetical protein
MAQKLIRFVALVGVALTATSCKSIVENELKTISAGHTGCTPDQLTISNLQHVGTFGSGETWNATCNGKVYLCSGVSGKSSGDYSCAPVAQ